MTIAIGVICPMPWPRTLSGFMYSPRYRIIGTWTLGLLGWVRSVRKVPGKGALEGGGGGGGGGSGASGCRV